MKYLFIDTETTGLPKEYDAPYTDIDNWPRLVQLAWIVYDYTTIVVRKNFIIKPIGFTIPNASTKVHGITTKQALEKGQKVETILKEFLMEKVCSKSCPMAMDSCARRTTIISLLPTTSMCRKHKSKTMV